MNSSRAVKFTSTIGLLLSLIAAATEMKSALPFQEQGENDQSRAASLIEEAIKARGGGAYLNVRTMVSRGEYTPFVKGVSTLPQPFLDYIAYPDRERTEFGKGDHKFIQTNVANSGWVYEAEQKMIRDQTDEVIKRWAQAFRYDLDNLLRHGWREKAAKLVYLGRREAWRNTFSEAVRIDFADGASVTLHLDPRSKLPLMTEYKIISGEGTSNEQVRYFQWIELGGIEIPKIMDGYREGVQISRAYFETVTFNVEVPEKIFSKPASIKEVK